MIVITAPTGTIGHQVVENVLHGGAPVRVVARDPARLPANARLPASAAESSMMLPTRS